jgi:4-diphosphocytidyl-2-C-methyl-D-erythritol kinase
MGGFAGGDEAGFWDEDKMAALVQKQQERKSKNSPLYVSNENLYFAPCKCKSFTVEGSLNSDIIVKAYELLCSFTNDSDIEDFFKEHKVVVKSEDSSSLQSFLHLVREECNLLLSNSDLEEIERMVK